MKSVGREVLLSEISLMVRICRVLSVWCVAVAFGWVATAAAEPAEDLINAADRGDVAVVQALLAKGVKVNAKAENGHTALMAASFHGHRALVQALLDKKAEVNAKMNNGWTALILASQEGHREVVQALLTKRAEVNVQGNDGTTALGAATKGEHSFVRSLLMLAGAKP